MEHGAKSAAAIPLLNKLSSGGTTSSAQTLGNIIVSVVGTGVLGLPFAFRIAGWLAGSLGVIIAALATYYCMLNLVECRDKISAARPSGETITYGHLGHQCFGRAGRYLTEFLIVIAQCGGSVAYLVFIGQNLSSIFGSHGLTFTSSIFILVPIEIALSWIRTLSALAPFSIFADICNVMAMAIALKAEAEQMMKAEDGSMAQRKAITSDIGGLPFAGGVAVFCFEGFGLTLALEESMKDRKAFPRILALAFTGITLAYVAFGVFGYLAYGDETKDIVTLNLPADWSAIAVQIGLCLALMFTLPIMMHPIHEIVEGKLKDARWFQKLICTNDDSRAVGVAGKWGIYVVRAILVVGLAILASFVPGFGVFVSLVGSTMCGLISFVLPAFFHLTLLGSSLRLWRRAMDYCILFGGLLFAAYGAYNAIFGVSAAGVDRS